MKQSPIGVLLISLVLASSSCRPSESRIVTAMAQTEIVRSATYVVETQEAETLATENAMRTSAAQSTNQAATTTKVHQETLAKAAEETAVFESTILAATATASSMQSQVQELMSRGILSHSGGTYYSLNPEFDNPSEDFMGPFWDTGFAPTDFVIRFDYSCPYPVHDDPSGFGIDFRKDNYNFYAMSLWSGRVRIWRSIDFTDIDFEVPDDWQPGDDPIIIDTNPNLAGGAIPQDKNEIRFMLVVEGAYFTVFADGEKLFHAYNTILTEGDLLITGDPTESDCQAENIELWILE